MHLYTHDAFLLIGFLPIQIILMLSFSIFRHSVSLYGMPGKVMVLTVQISLHLAFPFTPFFSEMTTEPLE